MEIISRSNLAEIKVIADPAPEAARQAAENIPGAAVVGSLAELLEAGVDGVVIATPSAQHAKHALAALERGVAVFCQKPLGRDENETRRIIAAARKADCLLGVDLSYRYLSQVEKIRELIRQGELGEIYLADLIFHNAYGPDKPWFYDRSLSGGGCVIDLGIHLVDLALWNLDFPKVVNVTSRLFAQGKPISGQNQVVEDFAVARLDLENGGAIQLACSWKLPAGCDAVIGATFYGTRGGASVRNVDGSFYEFIGERFRGTKREALSSVPEEWGGKAALDWVAQLASGAKFDPEIEKLALVAAVLDAIYDR
jgi:predicted dehydrogenase